MKAVGGCVATFSSADFLCSLGLMLLYLTARSYLEAFTNAMANINGSHAAQNQGFIRNMSLKFL